MEDLMAHFSKLINIECDQEELNHLKQFHGVSLQLCLAQANRKHDYRKSEDKVN